MKAINKNLFREIAGTKNRFMSIFCICAIGVGFFSGVRATGNDMKVSADDYYDSSALFDLRVLSTFGLTEDDAAAIAEVEGVSGVFASKYTDLAMHCSEEEFLTRVYSMNGGEVNKVEIVEGRLPEAENECIVSYNTLRGGIDVGDTVRMEDLTEADEFPLKYPEYNVVGIFNTPMFISLTQRGSTNIGDGAIDAFAYIAESNFTQDIYTEIYVVSDELTALRSYSDEYEQLRGGISDKLEELGGKRSEIRYEEVLGEALTEIEDGERELSQAKIDGRKELDDAKEELADAEKEIADGENELAEAKAELDDGAAQLADAEKELADAKKELDDGWSELAEAKAELDEAAKTLSDSKAELDRAGQELSQGRSKLNESKKQLDDGQQELDVQAERLAEGKRQLEAAKAQLDDARAQYDAGSAQYETGLSQYNAAKAQLDEAERQVIAAEQTYGKDNPAVAAQRAELEAGKAQLAQNKAELDAAAEQLAQSKAQLDAAAGQIAENETEITQGEAALAEGQRQLDEGRAEYERGLSQLEESEKLYNDGKKQYLDGLTEYKDGLQSYYDGFDEIEAGQREYDEGAQTLAEKRAEYEDGVREYNEGLEEIEDAKRQYEDGLREYEQGEKDFASEIADAEKELSDARREIEDAGEAEWYIFTRDDNAGYTEYESNSHRIDRIASIFPVFFLLVAALVCLTTMSRMVEEQRTQIGTLKALGYSNTAVMRHYMVYAVSAAALGGLIGAIGGCFLFPWVIIYAYSMMYNITRIHFLLSPANITLSVGTMVAAIALTVFFSCKKALAETPAGLMRPKAPKAGKRVLIERIGFIWNKMSFFGKVSGRNLFRYKRRMFMTVVGIAGCTALSLTGFGLKDSITDIVNLQYDQIYKYDGYIAVEDDISESALQAVYDGISAEASKSPETEPTQPKHTRALLKQYTVSSGDNSVQCYVTGVEDADVFEGMVDLHERVSGEKLSMKNGNGAIATEKLAKLLKIEAGDTITVHIGDSRAAEITISGITEHYASHYLYLTEELYRQTFGSPPEYNMVYFSNGMSDDEAARDAFSERLLGIDGVLAVMMNSGASSTFSDTVKILDLVIIVLIVSAGALAFVVLYNLTNINITERIREIATLKVLGFYDREVSNYVFRESIILSVMGAAVGLLLGVGLCEFVITTAELDEMMFGRQIHVLSFVWAFVITTAFSLIVNLIMTRELKKISMVESLKSVE